MNEVKKCSLSGIAFTMEADAYAMLKEYIDALEKSYGNKPEGREIVADIEARFVELILSTQNNDKVVERPLIANIIAQLGSVEDISSQSAEEEDARSAVREPSIPRRLYRDMENARLGGVCAGIAKYFDIDIPLVRLGAVSPLLLIALSLLPHVGFLRLQDIGLSLFWVSVLCYLVLWFAVPAARSPRQKLEANGERITVKSIHNLSASSTDVDRKARPVVAETVTVFGRIMILLLKFIGALVVFALTMLAMGLIIGMGVVLFQDGALYDGMGTAGMVLSALDNGTIIAVLGISVVLVPVIMLLYVLICLLISAKTNRTLLLVLFLLWIVLLIALPVTAVRSNRSAIGVNYTYENHEYVDEHERLVDSIERAAESYVLPEADEVDADVDADADDEGEKTI